jgi:hypothetical protein
VAEPEAHTPAAPSWAMPTPAEPEASHDSSWHGAANSSSDEEESHGGA